MSRILVIDDDEQMRGFVQETLIGQGYEVTTAENGKRGLDMFKEHGADLVITDMFMPEKEGCETIMFLKRVSPETSIIAMSGGWRGQVIDCLPMATKLGADRTLYKPFSPKDLLKAVAELLGK